MTPRRTVKHFSEPNGEFYAIRDYAPDPIAGALFAAKMLEEECPEDWHPWACKVQKARSGRRASVEVVFKQNRLAI